MNLKNYLRRAISLPPHKLALKVLDRTGRRIRFLLQRQKDIRSPTYNQPVLPSSGELHRYLKPLPINLLHSQVEKISMLAHLFLAHEFNLLGSGWVQVKHGISCRGLEGHRYEMGSPDRPDREGYWLSGRINQSNLAESQRIWSLVDHGYIPIDWHLDFKSGFRWTENTWYPHVPHGRMAGVDIKVPWEMARMQHLPLLVWAYSLAKDGQEGFAVPSVYVREFRNQVLDFTATNPPRFGVNWKSPMDVGIRVANWLVTYDLFRTYGVEFDNEFRKEFFRSIYEHGLHIIKNLEWNDELRGNHYLSNIIGLLFVAAYLPRTSEVDVWLSLAVQELVNEVGFQFNSDGSNFEASTSYHRLSTEMVAYATALVLGLPEEKREALVSFDHRLHRGLPKLKPAPISFYPLAGTAYDTPFPIWYVERLEKMAEFTMDITKPNRRVIQVGDNDSGRFLKLHPMFNQLTLAEAKARYVNSGGYNNFPESGIYWDENPLDHCHLVAAINALFQRGDFTRFTGEGCLETDIIPCLAKGICLPSYKNEEEPTRAERTRISLKQRCQGLKLYVYPNFGLYVFRSEDVFVAIRCGSIGQNGRGGHAHNDNLSFELNVGGRDFIVDGGSYLYTPFPDIRNMFRSTRAHSTLTLNGFEQNRWANGLQGLFSMRPDVQHRILYYNEECFEGEYFSHGIKHGRSFKLGRGNIIIEDTIEGNLFGELNLNFAPGVEIIQISKKGLEEFTLQIKNNDIYPRIIFKGFSKVEITEGFFSNGYGVRLKNQLLKCHRSNSVTTVIIEIG